MRTNFFLQITSVVIFFSTMTSVFYHIGLMQHVVNGLAFIMQTTMDTSTSESVSAAANIFLAGVSESAISLRQLCRVVNIVL
jgi:CNT family concentrative nucleoside transporter